MHRQVTAGLLLAFLTLIPWIPHTTHSAYDTGRVWQSGLMLFAAFGSGAWAWAQLRWRFLWWLVLLLSLASMLSSAVPLVAAREMAMYMGLLALAIICWQMSADERGFVLDGLVLGWLAYGLQVLIFAMLAIMQAEPLHPWRLLSGFDNPRYLNHVQVVVIPLLLSRAQAPGVPAWLRRAAWSALVLQGFLLGISQGRSVVVALLGALLVMLTLGGAQGRRAAMLLLGSLLAGAGLYYVVCRALPQVLDQSMQGYALTVDQISNSHSRGYLWGIAGQHIRAHPWLGVGPMHFAHDINRAGAHPHNLYLQWAAEFGLPAAVLAVGLLADALVYRGRQICRGTDPNALILYAGMVAVLLDACFSGNLVMPLSQTYIALLWGWGSHGGRAVEMPTGTRSGPWRTVLVCLLLLLYCIPTWKEFGLEEPAIGNGLPGDKLDSRRNPRFWQQGWF